MSLNEAGAMKPEDDAGFPFPVLSPSLKDWLGSRWTKRIAIGALTTAAFAAAARREVKNSDLQYRLFSHIADKHQVRIVQGPASEKPMAPDGPFDRERGYSDQAARDARLAAENYTVTAQATGINPHLLGMQLDMPYRETMQAGLTIRSSDTGDVMYAARYPHRVYRNFADIPQLETASLAAVEDAELLKPHPPTYNSAVNPKRLAYAMGQQALHKAHVPSGHAGGSTLAVQLNKFEHSPDGITHRPSEKLAQIVNASVQNMLYDNPAETDALRYINGARFSAYPNYGQVVGFGDAMNIWFGEDFDAVNALLRQPDELLGEADLRQKAKFYREILSLIMAVKKPTDYLHKDFAALQNRVDSFLPLLTKNGIITSHFAELVRAERANVALRDPAGRHLAEGPQDKTVQNLRLQLIKLFHVGQGGLGALDHLDVTADTTIDLGVNRAVADRLRGMRDPKVLTSMGMTGYQLANPAYAKDFLYTYQLKEITPNGIKTRIETDNFPGPLNLNRGMRLQLGSTAKTFVDAHLLTCAEEIHHAYAGRDAGELKAIAATTSPRDHLTRRVLAYLADPRTEKSLAATLDAVQTGKTYSGDTGEPYFTGGGLQRVHNFVSSENNQTFSPEMALALSVNAANVRMQRDVFNYIIAQKLHVGPEIFADQDNAQRRIYLERFAHQEGNQFLADAWHQQKSLTPDQTADLLFAQSRRHRAPNSKAATGALAVIYRATHPHATSGALHGFIAAHQAGAKDRDLSKYDDYGPARFNLNDRIYIAGHRNPMALWLAEYRAQHPDAGFADAAKAAADAQIEAYSWLLKPRHPLNKAWAEQAGKSPMETAALLARKHIRQPQASVDAWLARFRADRPQATFDEASAALRQKSPEKFHHLQRLKHAQDKNIETMLQIEAADVVLKQWQDWGYPFRDLPATYLTAIGVAGQTPNGLNVMEAILANDGVRMPETSFDDFHFAENTAYFEARTYTMPADAPRRVMSPEVATLVRRAQGHAVTDGTARRLNDKNIHLSDGRPISFAVKTGTGSNRDNRTASVMEIIECGDRKFVATTTAAVLGPKSAQHHFTSAFMVQFQKAIWPEILPVIDRGCRVTPLATGQAPLLTAAAQKPE